MVKEHFCDLHTHSTFSDGTDTPTELIKKAEQAGLAAIALTDHNSISGLTEFLTAAKESSVIAVPGTEFSTEYNGKELHIVGLFIKEEHFQNVNDFCENVRKSKENSNQILIDNLIRAGYAVKYEELLDYAQSDNINRAVIAGYLIEKGIVKDRKEAFTTLLAKDGGFYVPAKKPSTFDTIQFIKSIGAVAVLAHPFLDLSYEEVQTFLPEAKKYGLDAIETDYSTYDGYMTKCAKMLALKDDLLFSGGSDYHGKAKTLIRLGVGKGNLNIPLEYYKELAKCASIPMAVTACADSIGIMP